MNAISILIATSYAVTWVGFLSVLAAKARRTSRPSPTSAETGLAVDFGQSIEALRVQRAKESEQRTRFFREAGTWSAVFAVASASIGMLSLVGGEDHGLVWLFFGLTSACAGSMLWMSFSRLARGPRAVSETELGLWSWPFRDRLVEGCRRQDLPRRDVNRMVCEYREGYAVWGMLAVVPLATVCLPLLFAAFRELTPMEVWLGRCLVLPCLVGAIALLPVAGWMFVRYRHPVCYQVVDGAVMRGRDGRELLRVADLREVEGLALGRAVALPRHTAPHVAVVRLLLRDGTSVRIGPLEHAEAWALGLRDLIAQDSSDNPSGQPASVATGSRRTRAST